ncbi:acyl-CoA N-acyltransferase [Trametes meyenii]|nr:acyl-CoA N-acyltransferase [Trametes meyenii]
MSYVNNYQPAPPLPPLSESELYGPEPYDINFSYPLHENTLQNERTKLVPFVPSAHAENYWKHVGSNPELFRYYPYTFSELSGFLTFLERRLRQNPHDIFFAVIDKTRPDPTRPDQGGSFAGVVGLFHTNPANLSTEIAYVLVFPEFRGSHVAKDMIGLLLRYTLELPSAPLPGIGFRRVHWSAHPKNAASIGLAQRMGFTKEGTTLWMWVLPDVLKKEGRPGRIGDAASGKTGRDTVCLSLCWDEWENGARERVQKVLG